MARKPKQINIKELKEELELLESLDEKQTSDEKRIAEIKKILVENDPESVVEVEKEDEVGAKTTKRQYSAYKPPKQHLKNDEWKQMVWATIEKVMHDRFGNKISVPTPEQPMNPQEFKNFVRNATMIGFTHITVHYHPDIKGFKKWYKDATSDDGAVAERGRKREKIFPVHELKFEQ